MNLTSQQRSQLIAIAVGSALLNVTPGAFAQAGGDPFSTLILNLVQWALAAFTGICALALVWLGCRALFARHAIEGAWVMNLFIGIACGLGAYKIVDWGRSLAGV